MSTSHSEDIKQESEKTIALDEKSRSTPTYLDNTFQDRDVLTKWLQNKVKKDALSDYQIKNNARSLDGLPGLTHARRMNREWVWLGNIRASFARELSHPMAILLGFVLGLLVAVIMARHIHD